MGRAGQALACPHQLLFRSAELAPEMQGWHFMHAPGPKLLTCSGWSGLCVAAEQSDPPARGCSLRAEQRHAGLVMCRHPKAWIARQIAPAAAWS